VADIAHEVKYRLKEGNTTKWLFIEADDMPWVSHHPLTKHSDWLGHNTSCVGVNEFLATKHPKKHKNGHLPGVNNHL
jgi:hypothetical protein